MGNGFLKEQDWRVARRMVSYKQFLVDIKYANHICKHAFAEPTTGAHLTFEPFTNVEHHELLPVLWRLEGKLLIIVRSEKPPAARSPSNGGVPAIAGEVKERDEDADVGRALTVPQFYHLYVYLTDNLPLLQQARARLQQLSSPAETAAPSASSTAPAASSSEEDDDDSRVCSICMSSSVELALPCLHAFCRDCIEGWHERDDTCPLCRVKSDASKDEVWVMDSGNEKELREQISTVSSFPHVYIGDKPQYAG